MLDHLTSESNRALITNLVFATNLNYVTRFRDTFHASEASGISPFTSYELDFSKYGQQLLNELTGVKQFVLVIEVEAVSGERAKVPVCSAP